jgi:hypothetical protein
VIRSASSNIKVRRAVGEIYDEIDTRAETYASMKARAKKVDALTERYERDEYDDEEENVKQDFYSYRPKTQNLRSEMVRARKKNRTILLGSIFAILFGVFVLMTYVFNYGTVTLSPKSQYVTINNKYELPSDSYKIVDLSKTDTKPISSSVTKEVKSKATGKIIIYNNFDSSTQKLVPNTRFETKDGKVYRITAGVVIPGKTDAGPGSVEANVSADSYGADYNIGITEFTIPGFKGTPRYTGFYAKSKTAMAGGASGKTAVVSKEDVEDKKAILVPTLEEKVRVEILNIKDDGYVVVPDSLQFEYSDNRDQLSSSSSGASFQQTVKGKVLLVNTEQMYKLIARKMMDGYKEEAVLLESPEILSYSYSKDMQLNASTTPQLLFTYDGRIKYNIDKDAVANLIVGKDKLEAQKLLIANYYNVLTGDDALKIKIMPWWSSSFPSSVSKVHVEENLLNSK